MNKHRYQAKELQQVDWTRLAEEVTVHVKIVVA